MFIVIHIQMIAPRKLQGIFTLVYMLPHILKTTKVNLVDVN